VDYGTPGTGGVARSCNTFHFPPFDDFTRGVIDTNRVDFLCQFHFSGSFSNRSKSGFDALAAA